MAKTASNETPFGNAPNALLDTTSGVATISMQCGHINLSHSRLSSYLVFEKTSSAPGEAFMPRVPPLETPVQLLHGRGELFYCGLAHGGKIEVSP